MNMKKIFYFILSSILITLLCATTSYAHSLDDVVKQIKKDGFYVISVVINSPQMWERTQELYDDIFENYTMREVFNSENINNVVYTSENGTNFKIESVGRLIYPIKNGTESSVKYKVNGVLFKDFIKNPSENGIFEIFNENELIFSQNIFTILCK